MSQVKFCENNFGYGTDDVVSRLENEGVDVEVAPCLGYCDYCAVGPFAFVHDELVETDTPEELYNEIKKKLS